MNCVLVNNGSGNVERARFKDLEELYNHQEKFKKEYPARSITLTLDEDINFERQSTYSLWINQEDFELINEAAEFKPGGSANKFYKKSKFNDSGNLAYFNGFIINKFNKEDLRLLKDIIKAIER